MAEYKWVTGTITLLRAYLAAVVEKTTETSLQWPANDQIGDEPKKPGILGPRAKLMERWNVKKYGWWQPEIRRYNQLRERLLIPFFTRFYTP